jgi:hypothetical protein
MAQLPLTYLVDVSVSGAPVASLSSGVIALEEGKAYGIDLLVTMDQTALQQAALYFNGDQTNGNYDRTYVQSNNAGNSNSTAFFITPNISSYGYCSGIIGLQNSTPFYCFNNLNTNETDNSVFGILYGGYNTVETTLTEVELLATLGTLYAGTRLRIWEQIQST